MPVLRVSGARRAVPVGARRRRRRALWTGVRWLLAAAIAWFALCAVGLVYLRFFPPLLTMLQLQRWVQYGDAPGSASGFVPLARLGPHLPHAVIAAEDTRFFMHGGVDWAGVREAAEDNWERGRMWRGGSTITQQLVKNLFFTTHLSALRKLYEVPLSLLAEVILPKRRILELYLNVVEWGPGTYGGEDAAQRYFGVPAAFLGREQAARLAAVLPAPRVRRPKEMSRYSGIILKRMAAMGW